MFVLNSLKTLIELNNKISSQKKNLSVNSIDKCVNSLKCAKAWIIGAIFKYVFKAFFRVVVVVAVLFCFSYVCVWKCETLRTLACGCVFLKRKKQTAKRILKRMNVTRLFTSERYKRRKRARPHRSIVFHVMRFIMCMWVGLCACVYAMRSCITF